MTETFTNVAAHLPEMARRQPGALAVAMPVGGDHVRRSYRQLDEESDRLASGLEAVGVGRGVRTVLMVPPGLEFFALTFALFKVGAVPVLVDPGMGVKNLGRCLEEAAPEAFIGIPKAQAARLLLRWGRRTIRTLVTVGRRWFWGGWKLDQVRSRGGAYRPHMTETSADEPAAILFTSGSTGPPKGAVYTHGNFAAQVESLRRAFAIEPGEIDLCTFPLFALFAPALGMSAVVPDMDATRPGQVDPLKIIEPIQRFGVTNLFGSPALLRRVGEYGAAKGIHLPTLRRVISAGAPVAAEVLETFGKMLSPGVQIFTPYGATEALPVTSIGSDELLGETRHATAKGAGVCVGRPVGRMTVRIIRTSDVPIAAWSDGLLAGPGEIGEIVVQGPVVTHEYYHRPEATRLAKVPAREGFWHRMGDLGYFDEHGRLWFCGRKSQRVVTRRGTLYTIPCEAVFNAHPAVFRTALVDAGADGNPIPVLCVELRKGMAVPPPKLLKQELLQLGAAQSHTQEIQTILIHPGFPVDIRHNAKIGREELARWAAMCLSEGLDS